MTIEAFRANLIKKMGEKNFNGAGGLGSNCAGSYKSKFERLIMWF
jgi:hypothetical protein